MRADLQGRNWGSASTGTGGIYFAQGRVLRAARDDTDGGTWRRDPEPALMVEYRPESGFCPRCRKGHERCAKASVSLKGIIPSTFPPPQKNIPGCGPQVRRTRTEESSPPHTSENDRPLLYSKEKIPNNEPLRENKSVYFTLLKPVRCGNLNAL